MKYIIISLSMFIISCVIVSGQNDTEDAYSDIDMYGSGTYDYSGFESRPESGNLAEENTGSERTTGTYDYSGFESRPEPGNPEEYSSGAVRAPAGTYDYSGFESRPSQGTETYNINEIASYRTPSWYTPSSGEPMSIRKIITPVDSDSFGVLGDAMKVYVEITNQKKNRADRTLKGITIRELVDDELRITRYNDAIAPKNIDDISRAKLRFFREGTLNYDDIKEITIDHRDDLRTSSEDVDYFLFNWSINETKKIKNILMRDFDVFWAEEAEITGPFVSYENGINSSIINVTNSIDKDEWVMFRINDLSKNYGILILNISGDRTYDLKYGVSKDGILKVYDYNRIIEIGVDHLDSKEKIVYVYYIQPKKTGLYSIESFIRIADSDYSSWPDIIYPLEVKISEPDMGFRVTPLLETDHVFPDGWNWISNDRLKLKYEIAFVGNTLSKFLDNITVKIVRGQSNEFYFCDGKFDSNITIDLDFTNSSIQYVETNITYNESGVHRLPGIEVEKSPYNFPDKIIVEDPYNIIISKIITYNSVILILISLFGAFLARKEIKDISSKLKNKICRNRPNAPGNHEENKQEFEALSVISHLLNAWSTSLEESDRVNKSLNDLKNEIEMLKEMIKKSK